MRELGSLKNVLKRLAPLGLAAALAMSAGCDRRGDPNDPKSRLQDYISRSFSVRSVGDRKALLDFLAGETRDRLASWSDEQFRTAFIENKRKFLKLAIHEVKAVSPTVTGITYELVYQEEQRAPAGEAAKRSASSGAIKITNKKFCQLTLGEDKRWYISDVRNIKQLVEFTDSMDLP